MRLTDQEIEDLGGGHRGGDHRRDDRGVRQQVVRPRGQLRIGAGGHRDDR